MTNQSSEEFWKPRYCFHEPILEMIQASKLLSKAADFILENRLSDAAKLIVEADMPILTIHATKIEGKDSFKFTRYRQVPSAPPKEKCKKRMPPYKLELSIYDRDGWHCRFCQTPVISKDARKMLTSLFPTEARWGNKNVEKHRGLSILESSLDHLLPHNRGGDNSPENLVTACGPCQFGRGGWTIEEVGIINPFNRKPISNDWDGLRRILNRT